MTNTADHKITDQELLRTYAAAKYNYRYEGPIDDWPRNEERALTVAGLRAVIAADRARRVAPPAEGEVGELVAKLRRLALQNPLGTADPTITRAAALIEQQTAELATLRRLREEMLALVSESTGVAGLHLNGDIALWDELLSGGRFERFTALPSKDRPHG